jgi:hypothetical protein
MQMAEPQTLMGSLFPTMTEDVFKSIFLTFQALKKHQPSTKSQVHKQFLQDSFIEHKMFFSKEQVETLFQSFLGKEDDYEIGHYIVCMCNVPWSPAIMANERGALCYWGNMAERPGGLFRCIDLVLRNTNLLKAADLTKSLFHQLKG